VGASRRLNTFGAQVESKWRKRETRGFQAAQGLPLAPRFSKLPFAFALVAAPVLALSIAAFMTFPSFDTPGVLRVGIAPDRCGSPVYERVIVLHITEAGKLLINFEDADWNTLAGRLSMIYSTRAEKTIYLHADDGVPFQTVADAIDIVKGATFTGTSDPLGINVQLITPAAMQAHCSEKSWVPLSYPKLVGKRSQRHKPPTSHSSREIAR
jgi:biopolymer transport protein ExbD